MITNNIIYKNHINKSFKKLKLNNNSNKKFSNILKDMFKSFENKKNMLYSFNKNFKLNFKKKDLDNLKKFKKIIIIGMGGSILCSEAIYCFLKKKIKKEVKFLDDIDENKINELKLKKSQKKILFIIISKSGNTIETLSNFFTLKILKKNSKNIIIISEKGNNSLFELAKKNNLYFIEHKKHIGGRYSIFSEVGMIPSYLMGLNLDYFKKKIFHHLKYKNINFLKESSQILSILLTKNKYNNIVMLNYSPELNKFLFWLQQLIAESLGKNGNGFFPIISTAPKDHHSLMQLYLDGPKDKIFYIFSLKDVNNSPKINSKQISSKLKFLKNKRLGQLKKAQKEAFIHILKKKEIPFREFTIGACNEQILGELFSYFIIETIIVGRMSNINPFDQPAVEEIKSFTRKILS